MFGLGWFFGGMTGHHNWGSFGVDIVLLSILGFVCFILWIICRVKAYQGERLIVPIPATSPPTSPNPGHEGRVCPSEIFPSASGLSQANFSAAQVPSGCLPATLLPSHPDATTAAVVQRRIKP
jgi:hypothetical protein